ncbi:MAG: bifunctional UDP-N-acetylglucosamine diphosphorylase/glucosamine-1-phosphate N-acetyltransferase GlmU [Actinomycetota bacterium]|nr:MAG: bifunctional UDP-N-acetylglucosamine diphosphorylase/glucosamine-1-phosphate N-acetyltransferase GlmU [Actinomycetota bacterium]
MSALRPSAVVILAAGEGTRMRSATPKVLHEIAGRSLLGHVLAAVAPLEADTVAVVVGHGADEVAAHLERVSPSARTVVQAERGGTGHALAVALAGLAEYGWSAETAGPVVVVCGDTPLLRPATLTGLLAAYEAGTPAAVLLSADLPDPTGYGRVVRDAAGAVVAIVEQRDADAGQRAITEVNAGIYAFAPGPLLRALPKLGTANAQGEQYLTDVVALLHDGGDQVAALAVEDGAEILGVNDRVQLAAAGRILRDRIVTDWMVSGVTVMDPSTTWIDADAVIEPDATLLPGVWLRGRTAVAAGATVGPDCTLTDTTVGAGSNVVRTQATGAIIGPGCEVGPFTYLRPGAILAEGAKAGAYVEIKASLVGPGSKVPHLSYVGDAQIGAGSNIGAATVVVNYDGVAKHKTVIGDHVRIGSDTMLVAPVTVGDGAYTAAGSVITEDVPAGSMAVARGRQRIIRGWVSRRRAGSPAAAAAERAAARDAAAHEESEDR